MSQPAVQPVDVALRDGSTVRVRPVAAADLEGLRELLAGMSENSRWLRFLSAGVNVDDAARFAAEPGEGAGLVVTAGSPEHVVAHATYVQEGPGRAEVAFEVADEWHGRGIATILLAHLAGVAERAGITTFTAYVHPTNRRMIGVFRESGFPVEVRASAGELTVEMPAALGEAARTRFEDRERAAAAAAVSHVLRPASLALVGAGRSELPLGTTVLRRLLTARYGGTLHVVHPEAAAVEGVAASPSVDALPGQIDLGVLAVPAEEVLDLAGVCGAVGMRALVVLSSGFADAGAEGRRRVAELLATCRRSGMRLVGPNSLGVVNTDPELRLNATSAPVAPAAGPVSLASQSGAIGVAAISEAARRGVGLSTFVSTGDKADLSGNDFLQYWEQDPATRVVLLYLESFGNPRRFGRIARRVARSKPIVAVKSGRRAAGADATATRTRALLGASDVTVDALFGHAGIIRTETVAEQLDVAALLAAQPLPRGNVVGIVSNARGPAIACADACTAAGLRLADGPLDLGASAARDGYAAAIGRMTADADAVVAITVPLQQGSAAEAAAALRDAVAGTETRVPLLAVFMAVTDAELAKLTGDLPAPAYRTPEDAARALARAVRYASWRDRALDEAPVLDAVDPDAVAALIAGALVRGGGWLRSDEVDALLGAYGVPLVEGHRAETPEEAGRVAAELGDHVAVKAHCPGLPHRSDVGGVALGVRGSAVAERAAAECAAAVRRAGGESEGFVVQRMAPAGVEMVAGVLTDADFGPVVVCGPGGRTVELLGDVAVRLAPLGRRESGELLRSLRSFPLLDGYRGAPPADIAALEDVLLRISALAAAHAEVAEIDCDPVLAGPAGAMVIDARIRVQPPPGARPFPALDR